MLSPSLVALCVCLLVSSNKMPPPIRRVYSQGELWSGPNLLVLYPSRMNGCSVIASDITTVRGLSLLLSPSCLTNTAVRNTVVKEKMNWVRVNEFVTGDVTRPYPVMDNCPQLNDMVTAIAQVAGQAAAGGLRMDQAGERIGQLFDDHIVVIDGDKIGIEWEALKDTYITRSFASPVGVLIPGCLRPPWEVKMETHEFKPSEHNFKFLEDIQQMQTNCKGCVKSLVGGILGEAVASEDTNQSTSLKVLNLVSSAVQDNTSSGIGISIGNGVQMYIDRAANDNAQSSYLTKAAQAMSLLEELKNEIILNVKGRITTTAMKYYQDMGCTIKSN